MASIYFRETKGRWYVKYRDPQTGAWAYRSRGTGNKAKAKAVQREVERELVRMKLLGAPAKPSELTFEDLEERWKAWAPSYHQQSTIESYLWALRTFQERSGVPRISAVTPGDIEAFKAARADGKARTVNCALVSLRAVVNRAIRQGWYTGPNPFSMIEPLPEKSRAPRFLDRTQINAVMSAAEKIGPSARCFFALAIFAGFRELEADRARWTWVGRDAKVLHIREEDDFRPKDAEARFVPIHDELLAVLAQYRRTSGYIIAPDREAGTYRYRFDIRKQFMHVLREAGLAQSFREGKQTRWTSWVSPHVLRHTFASQLIMAGNPAGGIVSVVQSRRTIR